MSLATTVEKARLLARDFGESFQAQVAGDAESARFNLPVANIATTGLVVYTTVAGVVTVLTASADATPAAGEYYVEPRAGVITLSAPLPVGTTLTVEGTASHWSTPADLEDYVEIAFDLHARGRVPPLTWENVSPAEEFAIALLALTEALWAEIAAYGHDVDINTPEGMHIPAGQRFDQLLRLMELMRSRYTEIATALNVGPFRIVMSTLRRVSRTTGRLVPVYVAKEFDDHSPPVRVYPPIDNGIY